MLRMFKFTSILDFLALQLIIQCLLSSALSSATGAVWTSFAGVSPADESHASLVHVAGQCALQCQGRAGCQGFFYNDVSKKCVTATSDSDFNQSSWAVTGFRYYTTKYTCPKETTTNPIDIASSSCYIVNDTSLYWDAARDHCSSTGGQLAVLDTRGKVVFIMTAMENNTAYARQRYHLGASRPMGQWNTDWPGSGQDFVWLNGQPLDLTVAAGYWWPGDPDNKADKNENVIMLYYKPDFPGSWIDGRADDPDKSVGHVCQYSLV